MPEIVSFEASPSLDWELAVKAAVTVAGMALDADDARALLDALGISEAAGEGLARVRARRAAEEPS